MNEFTPESFLELGQRAERVSSVITQREALLERIGSGEITTASSWENAIKVGETRGHLKGSIERLKERSLTLNEEIVMGAQEFIALRHTRRAQLDQLKQLVTEENLSEQEILTWQREYEMINKMPEENAVLENAIERIDQSSATDLGVAVTSEVASPTDSTENGSHEEGASFLQLPPIPELGYIESHNEHKYDQSITVKTRMEEAESIAPEDLTSEQKQLFDDVKVIEKYTLSGDFKEVFTPEELHGLVEKFKLLESKNRPDFDGIEGRIIDFLSEEIREAVFRGRDDSELDSIKGVVKRAEREREERKGMNWDTLSRTAAIASNRLGERIRGKFGFYDYQVRAFDPKGDVAPNLKNVYQFVADDYALEVIGKRIERVTEPRQETYVANATIINEWYKQNEALIGQIPDSIRIPDGRTTTKGTYKLRSLIDTMNLRLTSTDDSGYGKSYMVEPVGAIKLQKRIAYTVNDINKELSPEVAEEEIVPLEEIEPSVVEASKSL